MIDFGDTVWPKTLLDVLLLQRPAIVVIVSIDLINAFLNGVVFGHLVQWVRLFVVGDKSDKGVDKVIIPI